MIKSREGLVMMIDNCEARKFIHLMDCMKGSL